MKRSGSRRLLYGLTGSFLLSRPEAVEGLEVRSRDVPGGAAGAWPRGASVAHSHAASVQHRGLVGSVWGRTIRWSVTEIIYPPTPHTQKSSY